MAAIGKSHTLFLMEDGAVYGVGANKAGQCGVKSSIDLIPNYRKCIMPDDVTIVKVCI
jgi:alpha-tubulin suppressor-like RCC1 family protein